MLRVEREEQDPLPLAEAELAVGKGHLLRARPEQEGEQPLARAEASRHDDFFHMIDRCLTDPDVGYLAVWGISNNTRRYLNFGEDEARLGYVPKQDSEIYAAELLKQKNPLDPIAQQEPVPPAIDSLERLLKLAAIIPGESSAEKLRLARSVGLRVWSMPFPKNP